MNHPFGLGVQCSRSELVSRIDGWLCSDPMQRLVDLFSRGWTPTFAPHESFYSELLEFVDDRWNSRGVVTTERYATEYKHVPPHLHRDVESCARDLGLLDPSWPSFHQFDAIVAPGSQLWSMIMRVGYMRGLRRRGVVCDRYVGLGSDRALSAQEVDTLADYALHGTDEFSLMRSIFGVIFSDSFQPHDMPMDGRSAALSDRWSAKLDGDGIAGCVEVLRAPDVGGKRPTTGDTLRHWIHDLHARQAMSRVLIVTQPLYLYQQGSVAIEVLGLEQGCSVEVVGASSIEYLPGFSFPEWPPERILQEVNGSVKRLVALRGLLLDGPQAEPHL